MKFSTAIVVAFVAAIQAATAQTQTPPPADKAAKVEFYWGENKPIAGLTEAKGIVWRESGEMIYLHKQPVLTNKDIVEVRVDKTVFGVGAAATDQFTVKFQLTGEARKRLADTCGPGGDKMLAAMVDGGHCGTPYYLKSRDESNFVPFAGMFTSKEKVDRIVATFAEAGAPPETSNSPKKIKAELHWAEFKPVEGVTQAKGVQFGEGSGLIYLHKQAVLNYEDIAEARLEGELAGFLADNVKLYGVNLYLTKEGKQKLANAGEPGKKKLLVTVLDGKDGSATFVDVADLSKFVQSVGFYEKSAAERLVKGINSPAKPAEPK